MPWASDFLSDVLASVRRTERARERAERVWARLEGGAVDYGRVPGGGGADAALELLEAQVRLDEERERMHSMLEAAHGLLFGAGGVEGAVGEAAAYAAWLHYCEAMAYSDAALRIGCSKAWAVHLSAKAVGWLDAHRSRPVLDTDRAMS